MGASSWSGEVPDESVVYAAVAHSDRWKLTVDGQPAERSKPFGWATAFTVPSGGDARLEFETSPLRYLLLLGQAVAWALVLRSVIRARVNAEPIEALR